MKFLVVLSLLTIHTATSAQLKATYTCATGSKLKDTPSNVVGGDDAKCCDVTCAKHTCSDSKNMLIAGAATTVKTTLNDANCCVERTCVLFTTGTCADDKVADTSKNATKLPDKTKYGELCCKARTCADHTTGKCAADRVKDTSKNATALAKVGDYDTTCCTAATKCAGWTSTSCVAANVVDSSKDGTDSTKADYATKCCKARTCALHTTGKCAADRVKDTSKNATALADVTKYDTTCCKAAAKCSEWTSTSCGTDKVKDTSKNDTALTDKSKYAETCCKAEATVSGKCAGNTATATGLKKVGEKYDFDCGTGYEGVANGVTVTGASTDKCCKCAASMCVGKSRMKLKTGALSSAPKAATVAVCCEEKCEVSYDQMCKDVTALKCGADGKTAGTTHDVEQTKSCSGGTCVAADFTVSATKKTSTCCKLKPAVSNLKTDSASNMSLGGVALVVALFVSALM